MPMSKIIIRTFTLLPLLLLCACNSTHYVINLRSGESIITASKPEFIEKTGYYRYRAINGKDALVRADEVLQMQEQ